MDLKSSYWQIPLMLASKLKMAFFIPEGKVHWNVLPMGVTNTLPFFVAFMVSMKKMDVACDWSQI
jgi:hypothetical protein